ncbi:hypothetical protein [Hymenobacter segetis]|uniref:DUF1682 domain-containing protein n=1 Tax=Hymenobacter segetis TaxID=2025509 RepID=A0ABU9LTK3_9BACT
MSLTAFLAFLANIPLKGVAAGAAGLGLKSLLNTLLTKLLDRRTERLKDDRSAVEREKDRHHEAKKWQHEAQEREKDREHEGKKWKHEKALALINAPARSTSSSVMAVA